MQTIKDIVNEYCNRIDPLDLELIISHILKKSREFIISHQEYKIKKSHVSRLKSHISRRSRSEPLAYILGHKEFYGLDFRVNKNVLIPRPETEQIVKLALDELTANNRQLTTVLDLGTGSGNIIISLTRNIKHGTRNKIKYYGCDINPKALAVAKKNAKLHGVDKKIKFLKSDLLKNKKLINNLTIKQCNNLIFLANLPYLSKKIYGSTSTGIKKYEPKSALFSPQNGLGCYIKLLKQLNKLKGNRFTFNISCFIEISPEQKPKITKLIRIYLPKAETEFYKDLAKKWRVCKIKL